MWVIVSFPKQCFPSTNFEIACKIYFKVRKVFSATKQNTVVPASTISHYDREARKQAQLGVSITADQVNLPV